jgi:hypothetical protein
MGILLFTAMSRQAQDPTQPPLQRVPEAVSLGIKRLGREADHSPPSNAEVQNAWSHTSTPLICLHGVMLSYKKQRDNYTFSVTLNKKS